MYLHTGACIHICAVRIVERNCFWKNVHVIWMSFRLSGIALMRFSDGCILSYCGNIITYSIIPLSIRIYCFQFSAIMNAAIWRLHVHPNLWMLLFYRMYSQGCNYWLQGHAYLMWISVARLISPFPSPLTRHAGAILLYIHPINRCCCSS